MGTNASVYKELDTEGKYEERRARLQQVVKSPLCGKADKKVNMKWEVRPLRARRRVFEKKEGGRRIKASETSCPMAGEHERKE